MKQTKFSILENKYYYGISRVFWHFIIGLGVLAIIAGVFVFIWSYVPPSKIEVVKSPVPPKKDYPKSVAVTFEEINNLLPKKKSDLEKARDKVNESDDMPEQNNFQATQYHIERDTTGLYFYTRQLNELKSLIPIIKNKTFWKGAGNYVYKGGDRGMRKFKLSGDESLRKWVATTPKFEEDFVKRTDNQNMKAYTQKAKLMKSFNEILTLVESDDRVFVFNNYFKNYGKITDLENIEKRLGAMKNVLGNISPQDRRSAVRRLKQFSDNNPKDGVGMQNFQAEIISKFDSSQRLNIINTINYEYYNSYNNKLPVIKENTLQFIPMVSKFSGDQQPVALQKFYKLFKNKNKDRESVIQQIDAEYEEQLQEIETQYQSDVIAAETEFELKKVTKKELKWNSLKGMLIGLGVILVISLILLILSMIRNVNRLAEAMIQNNIQKE